jgi:hypothetical protein
MRGPKDRHGIAKAVKPWRAETELIERRRLLQIQFLMAFAVMESHPAFA